MSKAAESPMNCTAVPFIKPPPVARDLAIKTITPINAVTPRMPLAIASNSRLDILFKAAAKIRTAVAIAIMKVLIFTNLAIPLPDLFTILNESISPPNSAYIAATDSANCLASIVDKTAIEPTSIAIAAAILIRASALSLLW